MSRLMVRYWSAFAAGGDPNAPDEAPVRVAWPHFTRDDPAILSISDTSSAKRDFAEEHKCGFWEGSGLVAPTW